MKTVKRRTKRAMIPLGVRVSHALRDLLYSAATAEDISQSDFCRRAIEERASRVLLSDGKRKQVG